MTCCLLLYPVLHLFIILFPLSSEVEAQKHASSAIIRQIQSVLNIAVAQCNFEPKGNSAIQLVKSNKCYVLQEEDSDSWNARDLERQVCPAEYFCFMTMVFHMPHLHKQYCRQSQYLSGSTLELPQQLLNVALEASLSSVQLHFHYHPWLPG